MFQTKCTRIKLLFNQWYICILITLWIAEHQVSIIWTHMTVSPSIWFGVTWHHMLQYKFVECFDNATLFLWKQKRNMDDGSWEILRLLILLIFVSCVPTQSYAYETSVTISLLVLKMQRKVFMLERDILHLWINMTILVLYELNYIDLVSYLTWVLRISLSLTNNCA